ncbi:MAG: 50S ribosomal protein L25/general stress protein Ctc [Gammaproteobacteria bacterium]|nr:50S ribosomal protein L25/general stress protein Ctc [Gammaproteobacteria bacterium]
MAIDFELVAETRNAKGKGASRRLRRADKVPGIIYGGEKPAVSVILEHNSLLKHLEHEAFYSHILTVKLDGKEEKAVLRDLQRHPHKPRIVHLDLQRVSATQKLRMRVPLHFTGADIAPGVKQSGGVVSHLISDLEVSCFPQHLPEFIEVDLSQVKLNESVHLSHLKLPEGVELVALAHGDDRAVASIHMPRVVEEEKPVVAEAAPAEGQPAAAPAAAEAKPAAGGKKE